MKSYSDNIIDTTKFDEVVCGHDEIKSTLNWHSVFIAAIALTQLLVDAIIIHRVFF